MTFYNAVLPGTISQGSEFAPVSLVDAANSPTGYSQRRSRRSRRLRRCNIGKNIRKANDVYDILAFFEVMNGPEHCFAITNLLDDRSCKPEDAPAANDAIIGSGDGANPVFQLKKQYRVTLIDTSVVAVDRTIYLPVQGTMLIAVGGVTKTETTHYTVNYTTGVVTFTAGNEPAVGVNNVTAGFKFREKVRFDTNDLSQVAEFFRVGSVPSIPLVEVPFDA
ncbi:MULTISPECIES: DUF2460 domain-containing protein [Mesorhizobium]|uniref:DUF2460 domain-containing protein n=1 Tax=Mesorhizobium TaxID=68287 RepID=UPI0010A96E8D|nr:MULTISPECIES: DUF2460 domain-containing protein [Mesorhizobium]